MGADARHDLRAVGGLVLSPHRGAARTVITVAIIAVLVTALVLFCTPRTEPPEAANYDDAVLDDTPVAYWPMSGASDGAEDDLVGGLEGEYESDPKITSMPNGDAATAFNGVDQFFEVPDSARLSPSSSGVMTIEAWMRPDTLQFDSTEGGDYVHWLGKGEVGAHEFAARMYNRDNDVDRPNRISGYVFNEEGGLGAGSAFEDDLRPGEWLHFAFVVNFEASTDEYPDGYTKIYRDGELRSVNDISIHGEEIQVVRTEAPFRVGTRDGGSFFEGAIGKVAIYGYEVNQEDLCGHVAAMRQESAVACRSGSGEGIIDP